VSTAHADEHASPSALGGVVLMAATALALVAANSPLSHFYDKLIDMPVEVRLGPLQIAKPLLLWVNDGLMAVFFFLVGLELKREMLVGDLSDRRKIVLPGVAAVGGMVVPALIYFALNHADPVARAGWAIPAATDIAFALGILALVGDRVPVGLKIFLVSLAIFDDVGAIVIIALFYTSELSLTALTVALACLPVLLLLNRRGVTRVAPYVLVGSVMWVALLKSGIHATLAGVALALFIPLHDRRRPERSPLRELEADLHGTVTFAILPFFAFANSGLPLSDVGLDSLLHPVPLGIALGLFVGKQVGVLAFAWLALRMGAVLPAGVGWRSLHGAAILCGVGFTMSLFIGSLAFGAGDRTALFDERLGILAGSILSGVVGWAVTRRGLAGAPPAPAPAPGSGPFALEDEPPGGGA
jgi:NhaA family Na+:H+ antiporter